MASSGGCGRPTWANLNAQNLPPWAALDSTTAVAGFRNRAIDAATQEELSDCDSTSESQGLTRHPDVRAASIRLDSFFELCRTCHRILASPKWPSADDRRCWEPAVGVARGGIPMEVSRK
jgi:hypothetical protein